MIERADNNNNNNNPIYIAPYGELQRRWAAVNQTSSKIVVQGCTGGGLTSLMFWLYCCHRRHHINRSRGEAVASLHHGIAVQLVSRDW